MVSSLLVFPFLSLLIEGLLAASSPDDSFYIGGVVDFHRAEDIDVNLKAYSDFIAKAKKQEQADIILFPEMGLYSMDFHGAFEVPDPKQRITPWHDKNQHKVLRNLSLAAFESKIYVVVNILEKSYSEGTPIKYNTNVVFDRNGTVIAKYRKFNLFGIELAKLNRTEKPESVAFDTDFGVKFGMCTCFDIMFQYPCLDLIKNHGVTDVLFPTAWFSELPFLTANQWQGSWSYGTGANLLAAGLNDVKSGNGGSGIYGGENGPIVQRVSEKDGSKLLVNKIKKKVKKTISEHDDIVSKSFPSEIGPEVDEVIGTRNDKKGIRLTVEDLTLFETDLLSPTSGTIKENTYDKSTKIKTTILAAQKKICQRTLCCQFSLSMKVKFGPKESAPNRTEVKGDDFTLYRYRFAVFDGVRTFTGSATGGIQTCGIIPCLNESLSTCGLKAGSMQVTPLIVNDKEHGTLELYSTQFEEIIINGTFNGSNSLIAPNVLKTGPINLFGLVPGHSELNFTKNKSPDQTDVAATLQLRPQKKTPIQLVTAAIYARIFDRDGLNVSKPVHSSSPSTTTDIFHITFITIVIVSGSQCFLRIFN